ncbi:MAG: hypothetical protein JOZ58_22090, partial [Acetobacteraceae bacterium]|nr:hypothetical protein [Acetobacteraceae bacterium]
PVAEAVIGDRQLEMLRHPMAVDHRADFHTQVNLTRLSANAKRKPRINGNATTAVTVLSDGEEAMPTMLDRWLDPMIEHRLDWWHRCRRLKKMREAAADSR